MQLESIKFENPKQFLKRLESKKVRVFTKWGFYYEGTLQQIDKYFNLIIIDCIEYNNNVQINLGRALIRCNNVKIVQEIYSD